MLHLNLRHFTAHTIIYDWHKALENQAHRLHMGPDPSLKFLGTHMRLSYKNS